MSLSRRAGVPALLAVAALAFPVVAATQAQAAPPAATQISIDDLTVSDLAPGIPETVATTIRLSNPVGHTVTVRYETANGTATAGQDYRATRNVATFTPGQTAFPVKLQVVSDGDAVNPEFFTVNLSAPTGGGAIVDPKGVIRLEDCTLVCNG